MKWRDPFFRAHKLTEQDRIHLAEVEADYQLKLQDKIQDDRFPILRSAAHAAPIRMMLGGRRVR